LNTNKNKGKHDLSDLINLNKKDAKIKIDKKRHAREDIPMHEQVIEPPNTKDIPRAAIESYLQAPTIQRIRQTRENNITVTNVVDKEPCKASIGHSSASSTSVVAIYAEYYRLSSRFL
jgi:hypothetical protein